MLISCKAFPGGKIAHLWILLYANQRKAGLRWLKPDMCIIFVSFYVTTSWCAKPILAPCDKFGPFSHGCSILIWLVIQLFLFLTTLPDDKFRIVWNHPPVLDASRKHQLFLPSGAPPPQSYCRTFLHYHGKSARTTWFLPLITLMTSRKCSFQHIETNKSERVVDQLIYLAGVN